MDVIDTGRTMEGGAGGAGAGRPQNAVSIGEAMTQVEADEIISKQLMSEGFSRDSVEFVEKHAAIRKESKVSELKLR